MEQWYVLLSLPKPRSLLFNSTRCEALVLPSVLSAAKGKGANQTRKRAQVPGSIPSSKPVDTIPTSSELVGFEQLLFSPSWGESCGLCCSRSTLLLPQLAHVGKLLH